MFTKDAYLPRFAGSVFHFSYSKVYLWNCFDIYEAQEPLYLYS